MKLLEQYHERLAGLINWKNTHPVTQSYNTAAEEKSASKPPPSPPPPTSHDGSAYRSQQQSAASAPPPQRDISSSIASNLASARGIPTNRQRRGSPASPASSAQHAEGKLTTPQRRSKLADYPTRAGPNSIQEKIASATKPSTSFNTPKAADQPVKPAPSSTDEPFNRFYSTFESLFNKLSAPLAFAGLPLGLDDPPTPEPTAATANKPSVVKEKDGDDPEYTEIFSRAALRAIQEERGLAAAESFYVVPSTGGTISYAQILARTKREAARSLGFTEPAEGEKPDDEFVDARETPQPSSPVTSRKGEKFVGGKGGSTKTMEELKLENQAMKDIIDILSRRVAQFEIGSQSQGMALNQSIRMMQQSQALPPLPGAEGVSRASERSAATDERMTALEEQLKAAQKENERMGRENEKLKGVVGRYRERWEKLKEGARTRRDGTGTGTGGEG